MKNKPDWFARAGILLILGSMETNKIFQAIWFAMAILFGIIAWFD